MVCVLILGGIYFSRISAESNALIHEYTNMSDNNELL